MLLVAEPAASGPAKRGTVLTMMGTGLSDTQMATLRDAGAQLSAFERPAFLRMVMFELGRRPQFGDGDVWRICRAVLQQIKRARDGDAIRGW